MISTSCTDLAVLKPFRLGVTSSVPPALPLDARHGVILIAALMLSAAIGEAQAAPGAPSIIATIVKWTPLLAQGFALNIAMSFLAMTIGTAFGIALGLGQISLRSPVRATSWSVTQFFRNSPWLVLLFYCMLLLPFEIQIGNSIVSLPGWAKATVGLALPVMANVSELVRGAVQSIPSAQWEASESLAFTRLQALRMVILPLAFRISLPALNNNLVNLIKTTTIAYAIAVPEMLYVANQIWSDESNVPEMMNVLLITYVSLVGILVWVMGRWERALRIPGYSPA